MLLSPSILCHCHALHNSRSTSSVSLSQRPLSAWRWLCWPVRCLALATNCLQESPKDLRLCIDIYDEVGIGGGASGVYGGLPHPYSPKGKLLLWGADCWKECFKLLSIVEAAVGQNSYGFIVQRRGILRPAMNMKNLLILNNNAQNCLASCRIETVDKETAQNLAPQLCMPFESAFYMPEAVNSHPQRYLQALFLACENLVKELRTSGFGEKELCLHKKSIHKLLNFEGEYDAVIVCLGAKADLLPELSGKLPLRTCRGVVAHMLLPADKVSKLSYVLYILPVFQII